MVLTQIDLSSPLQSACTTVLTGLDLSASLRSGPGFLSVLLTQPESRAELCQEYLAHAILKAWEREVSDPQPARAHLFRIIWDEPTPSARDQAWIRLCPPCQPHSDCPPLATEPLLAEYLASSLCQYHKHYYSQEPHSPENWPVYYDRIDRNQFPACISVFLEGTFPGWHQQAGVLHFTRGMLGMGWHPRHIAGLINSKLSRGPTPGLEAWKTVDTKVRCYSGLIHEGLDRLADFDCVSVQNQGFCPPHPNCPVDLCELKGHLGCGGWHP